jgi:hypothetical protein
MAGTGGMGSVFEITLFNVLNVTYFGKYLPIMAASSLIVMIKVKK